jgi:AcrR family transcriptional regulator
MPSTAAGASVSAAARAGGAAPSAGAPARRRARRSDSVRNASQVTEAAIELFAQHGMSVTLAQVADRAGVGKATVYRTYASREDLIAAMLGHRLEWLRQRMADALEGADPWREFAAMNHDVLQRMREDHLLRYVLAPGNPLSELGEPGERMSATLGPLFTTLLAAVKATGRVRQDVTALDTAVLMSGVAAALTSRQDFTEASWRRAADLVLAACGTYPPALGADGGGDRDGAATPRGEARPG